MWHTVPGRGRVETVAVGADAAGRVTVAWSVAASGRREGSTFAIGLNGSGRVTRPVSRVRTRPGARLLSVIAGAQRTVLLTDGGCATKPCPAGNAERVRAAVSDRGRPFGLTYDTGLTHGLRDGVVAIDAATLVSDADGVLVGLIPGETRRWERLESYVRSLGSLAVGGTDTYIQVGTTRPLAAGPGPSYIQAMIGSGTFEPRAVAVSGSIAPPQAAVRPDGSVVLAARPLDAAGAPVPTQLAFIAIDADDEVAAPVVVAPTPAGGAIMVAARADGIVGALVVGDPTPAGTVEGLLLLRAPDGSVTQPSPAIALPAGRPLRLFADGNQFLLAQVSDQGLTTTAW
jgi:hypothetical protein